MKIAVLGPKGTFSEVALFRYMKEKNISCEYGLFNSINETVKALRNGYDEAIIPIENTLDGYVQRTLDLLLEENIYVKDQVTVPVQFKLVSNVELNNIESIYVQFKALGQCNNFINSLDNVKIINTESNILSYDLWQNDSINKAAVVPNHLDVDGKYIYENITDSKNNDTRFIVVSKNNNLKYEDEQFIRVPIYIIPLAEYPGLLFNILKVFNDNQINLTTILSRPKKSKMGEYNFYIEVETTYLKLNKLLEEIKNVSNTFELKVLGIIKE